MPSRNVTKPTRTMKTPAERAIAALGVEQRRVKKLALKREALETELAEVTAEYDVAVKRLEHRQGDPDLPEANTEPIPGVDA